MSETKQVVVVEGFGMGRSMIDYNPSRVASVLAHDMGIEDGIKYANRIASANGPLSAEYAEAARILECRPRMCEECGKYPADWPSKTCAGCDSYADHTAVY